MTTHTAKIAATPANRKELRDHARNSIAKYSPIMSWLVLDGDELYRIVEPQGQSGYVGDLPVIAMQGDVYQAHGQGCSYRTQRDYLRDLLGTDYARIFGK